MPSTWFTVLDDENPIERQLVSEIPLGKRVLTLTLAGPRSVINVVIQGLKPLSKISGGVYFEGSDEIGHKVIVRNSDGRWSLRWKRQAPPVEERTYPALETLGYRAKQSPRRPAGVVEASDAAGSGWKDWRLRHSLPSRTWRGIAVLELLLIGCLAVGAPFGLFIVINLVAGLLVASLGVALLVLAIDVKARPRPTMAECLQVMQIGAVVMMVGAISAIFG